jgi:hypothetical protein
MNSGASTHPRRGIIRRMKRTKRMIGKMIKTPERSTP